MARPATGNLALKEARELLKTAKTADELRAAQAVVLPLDLGLSIAQTAVAVGRTRGTVARLRSRFIAGEKDQKIPLKRGGVRRQIISLELAIKLAKEAINAQYRNGWGGTFIDEFKILLEKHHGRPVGMSTVYRIYSRAVRAKVLDTRLRMVNRLI